MAKMRSRRDGKGDAGYQKLLASTLQANKINKIQVFIVAPGGSSQPGYPGRAKGFATGACCLQLPLLHICTSLSGYMYLCPCGKNVYYQRHRPHLVPGGFSVSTPPRKTGQDHRDRERRKRRRRRRKASIVQRGHHPRVPATFGLPFPPAWHGTSFKCRIRLSGIRTRTSLLPDFWGAIDFGRELSSLAARDAGCSTPPAGRMGTRGQRGCVRRVLSGRELRPFCLRKHLNPLRWKWCLFFGNTCVNVFLWPMSVAESFHPLLLLTN